MKKILEIILCKLQYFCLSLQAVVDAKYRVLIFSFLSLDALHDFHTYFIFETCNFLKELEGHSP